MTKLLLDPTNERTVLQRSLLPRPASLRGKTIGLLDISKPRGDVFLDRLEQRLTELGAGRRCGSRSRRSPSRRPSICATRSRSQCELVIEALAD